MDLPDHPPPNPTQTRSAPKRPLTDITDSANSNGQPKRRRGRPAGSRAVKLHVAPYNPTPPAPVILTPGQETRRSERLASRAPLSSQPLPQEDDDDDDEFDDPPPMRPYTGLVGLEESEEEEDRPDLVTNQARARRTGPRNRRDGRVLGPDYMIARRRDITPALHELGLLRDQAGDNMYPYCSAYQYAEECRTKPTGKKHCHCCADGRVSPNMMTSKLNTNSGASMPDGPEKEGIRRRDEDLKYLDDLLYKLNDSRKRRGKRSRRFHEKIVTYNSLLPFTSKGAKIDEKHSTWATVRTMGC